jgi:hypothetical protein
VSIGGQGVACFASRMLAWLLAGSPVVVQPPVDGRCDFEGHIVACVGQNSRLSSQRHATWMLVADSFWRSEVGKASSRFDLAIQRVDSLLAG